MKNKPSVKFGNHTEYAHIRCEYRFNPYRRCTWLHRKDAESCLFLNNQFMQCLEGEDQTPKPCIGLLYNIRKCKFDGDSNRRRMWSSEFEKCMKDPERYDEKHKGKYRESYLRDIS